MIGKQNVIKDLHSLSDRLSTQVRTVALGALALSWGLLIGESNVAKSVASASKKHLLVVGGLAILTMFLDFLQYVAGYINNHKLLKHMESSGLENAQYDYDSYSYRLRSWLFVGKQVALVVTVVWLLAVVLDWILNSS